MCVRGCPSGDDAASVVSPGGVCRGKKRQEGTTTATHVRDGLAGLREGFVRLTQARVDDELGGVRLSSAVSGGEREEVSRAASAAGGADALLFLPGKRPRDDALRGAQGECGERAMTLPRSLAP